MNARNATGRLIESLFSSSPAPIVAIDRNNSVTAWNPAAERLFGWSSQEMLGHSYSLVPRDGSSQYRAAMDRVFEGEQLYEYKARRRRKDGSLVDVSVALAPIRDEDDLINGALAIFRDITEQVLAENRAARLNNLLRTIHEVNQLIVREKDPNRLLQGICTRLIKYREYHTAWVALHADTGQLELRAGVGMHGTEAVFREAFSNDDLPGCVRTALQRRGATIIDDRRQVCSACPLEQACPQNASIVARLDHGGAVLGVMYLSLPAEQEMLTEERAFVPEVADDMAFALHSLALETEYRKIERGLGQREHDLQERIKELSCLYRLTDLVETPNITLVELFQRAVGIIAASWRYPEVAWARIIVNGQESRTANYRDSAWIQRGDIKVHGRPAGRVEVGYLEQRPEADEGPFLKEERHLIEAVAARFGRIIERVTASEALRESERRLSTLISNLPGMVYRCRNDARWTMAYLSEGCPEITGYPAEELIGETPRHAYGGLIHPEDRQQVWGDVQTAVKERTPFRLVYRITDASGEVRYLLEQGRGVYQRGGELLHIEGFITDITALKRAEAQAKQQYEQLMQADKMIALGTLVSGIGHEINNPNNFVMLNVPLLKGVWEDAVPLLEAHYQSAGDFRLRGIPFQQAREMIPALIDDITEGAWRIKRIVGELKDYARSQPTPQIERVNINEVVRSAIVLCTTFIDQHTQRFSIQLTDQLPLIEGSSQRIEQVVINLLQNACEALENNRSAVSISTAYDDAQGSIVISIIDEGIGIPEENRPQITDPFFTTKRASGGTGLGLSITERIVQDHGGTLAFDSTPGGGTTARVVLPLTIENEYGSSS